MRRRVLALCETMNVELDLSVGIAPVDGRSELESVLIAADRAMYAEKNKRAGSETEGAGVEER